MFLPVSFTPSPCPFLGALCSVPLSTRSWSCVLIKSCWFVSLSPWIAALALLCSHQTPADGQPQEGWELHITPVPTATPSATWGCWPVGLLPRCTLLPGLPSSMLGRPVGMPHSETPEVPQVPHAPALFREMSELCCFLVAVGPSSPGSRWGC